MDSYSWKRNLFPTYYQSSSLKDTRGSNHATRVITGTETFMPTKDTSSAVVSEQTPEDKDGNGTLKKNKIKYETKLINLNYLQKFYIPQYWQELLF